MTSCFTPYFWKLSGNKCIFSLEQIIQMKYNIWAILREAFCWLNENEVVVISYNHVPDKGHCELLDTVSLTLKLI